MIYHEWGTELVHFLRLVDPVLPRPNLDVKMLVPISAIALKWRIAYQFCREDSEPILNLGIN